MSESSQEHGKCKSRANIQKKKIENYRQISLYQLFNRIKLNSQTPIETINEIISYPMFEDS